MRIRKQAEKALNKMPRQMANKFYAAFELIEADNIEGLDIKSLAGRDGFRLRIGGYRAIFTNELELIVIKVGSRGDIYK